MQIPDPLHIAFGGARCTAMRPCALDPNATRKAVDEGLGVNNSNEIEQQRVRQRRQSLFDVKPVGDTDLLVEPLAHFLVLPIAA